LGLLQSKFYKFIFLYSIGILTWFQLGAEDKLPALFFFEKSDYSSAYLSSKQCLKSDPNNPICLRIFFLTEPSLGSLQTILSSIGNQPESNEMVGGLYNIAMEKAMVSKSTEYGLKWGEKIYETWKDRENSHKSVYFYAYFLSATDQTTKLGEVLNWLRSNTKNKSIQRKLDLLSKGH
jgi:hypothetical protein